MSLFRTVMDTLVGMTAEIPDGERGVWCYYVRGIFGLWTGNRHVPASELLQLALGEVKEEVDELAGEYWDGMCQRIRGTDIDTSEASTQTEIKHTTSTATDAEHKPTTSTATDAQPTTPARTYAAVAVQTPPARTYAAVAVQTPATHRGYRQQAAPPPGRKEGHRQQAAPLPGRKEGRQKDHALGSTKPGTPVQKEQKPPRGDRGAPPTTRALVMHAAPLKYKPGAMRRWIEEDNKGVKILGIRWLLREDRRGQVASSLVIYMRDLIEVTKLRMGRRLFRTTCYDWDR